MAQKIDLHTITIEKIIVHDIPKHKKGDISLQPNYSEQESELPDGLRSFFKDKVVSALSSDKAFKICYDADNTASPVSWIISDIIKSPDGDFVLKSKSIAEHLFKIQVGINAAGILLIILGKVNGFSSCMILKLERDSGAQLVLNQQTKSFNIREVHDLMLTYKTRIFKVALFINKEEFQCKFDGSVMDYQINVKEKKEASTYFIDAFLGCKPFEDPKITTQRFFNLTRTYIDTIEDIIHRAKYIQDLNSYLQKNNQTLNPKEFADDYFKTSKHKDDYKKFLETKKFKFSSFPKDTQLISNKFKKIVITFENDISIVGNKGTFDKKVKLEKLPNGEHKAEIVSKIRRIS